MSLVASNTAPPRAVDLHEWETVWSLREDAYELVAGIPTMTPSETGRNIAAAIRLYDLLVPALRPTHWLLPHYGVHLHSPQGRDTVRQPDLVVLPRGLGISRSFIAAADATLVVEVVSPSSIERDWVAKRGEYAAAGVPLYLIADVRADAPKLWLFDRFLPVRDSAPAGEGAPAGKDEPRHATTYPRYADPTGDGTSVTIRIPGHDPITISAADLADGL